VRGVYRMEQSGGVPGPNEWGGYLAQLLGAGGLGFLLRELVKRWFQRRDRDDDIAAGLRGEMVRRIESLERNYAALEERERQTYVKAVQLEAENRLLRRRWHALMNWIQSEPSLPQPPSWLNERIDGPTQDESTRRPEQRP
jgi:hypothetical protein